MYLLETAKLYCLSLKIEKPLAVINPILILSLKLSIQLVQLRVPVAAIASGLGHKVELDLHHSNPEPRFEPRYINLERTIHY